MTEEINTHGMQIGFGKHEGELYTRLPISYLRWMLNNRTKEWEYAEAELSRRGHSQSVHDIEISSHAVDRASCYAWKAFRRRRNDGEGLYSWLAREALWLLENEAIDDKGRMKLESGLYFVISLDLVQPVLKTVISERNKKR